MITINDLSFSYGTEKIFTAFSAELHRGERVCISAPSGAGKTTLLRLIADLEKPDGGTIETEGSPKIGMVFQSDALLPWCNALENVSIVCGADAAKQWLAKFGLSDAFEKYPSQMSGGMCRRVALARAVAFEPDVLLLDEAFKGLDAEIRDNIMDEIARHFKDRLVIFTSHEQAEIDRFATRIITL